MMVESAQDVPLNEPDLLPSLLTHFLTLSFISSSHVIQGQDHAHINKPTGTYCLITVVLKSTYSSL
eukprot:scaffold1003_cov161-Ochromonas_danica.AAC.4